MPFSSLCPNFYYLWFWASLGVSSRSQIRLSAKNRARGNREFLTRRVNYYSARRIRKFFIASGFYNFAFVEKSFLRNSPNQRGQRLAKVGEIFPLVFLLYRTFWSQVVFVS